MKHLFSTTIIALSLAACGSSGSSAPSTQSNTPQSTASPDAESSAVKNRSSLDYRRNYAGVVSSKSVIAAQTLLGPQAGSNTRGEKNLTLTLNGRSYGLADRINITALPDGLLELPYKAEWTSLKVAYPDSRDVKVEEQGKMYIYQRPYSMVLATLPTAYRYDGANDPNNRLGRADTMKV